MKKMIVDFFLAITLLLLTSCGLFTETDKDFVISDMTITLSDTFFEIDLEGFDFVAIKAKTYFYVAIDTSAPGYTLEGFANGMKNNLPQLTFKSGFTAAGDQYLLTDFEEIVDDENMYYYMVTILKYNGAFYIVTIACKVSDKTDALINTHIGYIDTIRFPTNSSII